MRSYFLSFNPLLNYEEGGSNKTNLEEEGFFNAKLVLPFSCPNKKSILHGLPV
jgi:hypothetical protein